MLARAVPVIGLDGADLDHLDPDGREDELVRAREEHPRVEREVDGDAVRRRGRVARRVEDHLHESVDGRRHAGQPVVEHVFGRAAQDDALVGDPVVRHADAVRAGDHVLVERVGRPPGEGAREALVEPLGEGLERRPGAAARLVNLLPVAQVRPRVVEPAGGAEGAVGRLLLGAVDDVDDAAHPVDVAVVGRRDAGGRAEALGGEEVDPRELRLQREVEAVGVLVREAGVVVLQRQQEVVELVVECEVPPLPARHHVAPLPVEVE